MKQKLSIILFIEVQLFLILFIIAIFKFDALDEKVFNTNKFIHELLTEKRKDSLFMVHKNDLVIGQDSAPVTLILYSRFDCSACNSFFKENFSQLKNDFIDKGKAKLVIRNLVHISKKETLFATKCAFYANQKGVYPEFIEQIDQMYPELDTTKVKSIVLELTSSSDSLDSFLKDKKIEQNLLNIAKKARITGIRSTPTLFINEKALVGTRRYQRIQDLILTELTNVSCD